MKLETSCADCYACLSSKIRIKIFNLLQDKGKLSVLNIAKHFKLTQPTITHHLQYLKKAGILSSEKQGRKIYYFINLKCGAQCNVF